MSDYTNEVEIIDNKYEILNLNKEQEYAMKNNMVYAQYNYSVNANKLFRIAVSSIKPNDEGFMFYESTIPELKSIFGFTSNSLYRDIDNLTNEFDKSIQIQTDDGGFKKYWLFSMCEFDRDKGKLIIKFNQDMKPFLLGLKDSLYYNKRHLSEIMEMKSNYSIRMLEMITEKHRSKFIKDGTVIYVTLEEIRKALQIENKYTKISHLRDKVIDVSIDEINEHSNIVITECVPKKRGRSIVGFEFTIYQVSSPYAMQFKSRFMMDLVQRKREKLEKNRKEATRRKEKRAKTKTSPIEGQMTL